MTSASELILNYVVNASWQTVAVVIVAALGSYLLRNAPARYRHILWLAALASCLLVPLLTATHRPSRDESVSITAPPLATNINPQSDLSVAHLTKPRTRVVNTTSHIALWLILFYLLFVAWRAITLVRFWRRKERLRRSATVAGLPLQVEQAAERCRRIFGLTNVSVAQSSVARMPYTLGARSPLIVLPEAFCTASDDRLLSVIGHEMAHVARRDYLTNLICELAALPISFHPLTFLIKRQIDRARELACDELVSKQLLPPKLYARSLVWAADVSSQPRSALVLSMFDGRSLEERVMRLTRKRKTLSRALARAVVSVTLFALCAATISLSLFSLELQTQARAVFIPAAPQNETAGAAIVTSETVAATQSRAERLLNASGAQERAEAACDAGRARDVEKMPALIAMLADDTKTTLIRCWTIGRWSPALETFKQPSPGEQAALALASLGRPAFLPLAGQLDNGNATVRRNAAWAIGELTNMPPGERDDAVPRLVTLLGDSDEWVRMAAARALGELRNQTAVPKLIATLSDSDGRVRELAVWALSELKDDRAVAALCSVLLADARVEVRRGAAEALGEIRSAEALPSLKQALNDPDVRARAEWAISEIEDSGE